MGHGPRHTLHLAEHAEALAASGRSVEAVQLLDKAVAAGDPDAAYTLAIWNLTGSTSRETSSLRANISPARASEAMPMRSISISHCSATARGPAPLA